MRENLPASLKLMFGHEGGYVNAATDRGGPTKYGVTHTTLAAWRGVERVSAAEVRALTLKEATNIYRAGYWTQSGGDLLPSGLDYAAFDFGVNSGPARAVRALQGVVGTVQDGSLGPMTLAAVRAYPGGVEKLIRDYCAARMAFLRGLTSKKTGFPVNGRGWTIRVMGKDPKGAWADQPGVIGHALAMARSGPLTAEVAEGPDLPDGVATETSAKATPGKTNPWSKPETIIQGVAGASGLSFLATGDGPVQWAVGAVLVVASVVAAVYIVRRISAAPA